MKEKFLKSSINLIKQYKNYSNDELEKLSYGLEGLYLTVTKLTIILIVAIILNIEKELIIVLVFFNFIRFFAFGMHADKSSTCLIFSTIIIIGLTYIGKNYNIGFNIKLILSIISIINYSFFAPADTIKRPFTNSKKRIYRKVCSIIIVCIYIGLTFIIKNNLITNLLLMSLIIEGILINPITYRLFNMPYNNYKNVS